MKPCIPDTLMLGAPHPIAPAALVRAIQTGAPFEWLPSVPIAWRIGAVRAAGVIPWRYRAELPMGAPLGARIGAVHASGKRRKTKRDAPGMPAGRRTLDHGAQS